MPSPAVTLPTRQLRLQEEAAWAEERHSAAEAASAEAVPAEEADRHDNTNDTMTAGDTNIQYLSGVGPKRAALLKSELGIETVEDLINLYPFRYVDRNGITPIADITPGPVQVQIKARVVSRTLYAQDGVPIEQVESSLKTGKCKRLSVIVEDNSGRMEMVFFKGIRWNWQRLSPGSVFIFFGKPQTFGNRLNMVHPEVDLPSDSVSGQVDITGVYPSTEKLKTSGITGKVMCHLMANALNEYLHGFEETLPEYVMKDNNLVSRQFALLNIHFPKSNEALVRAQTRLKFEELFLL